MNGFGNFMEDPLAQFGLGILAANRPGTGFGQAVGLGGLSALDNIARSQQMKGVALTRELKAKQLQAEMEQAKKDAEAQEEMEKKMEDFLVANPEYRSLANVGGPKSVASVMEDRMKPEKLPISYREWQLAGSPGTFAQWKETNKGGVNFNFPGPNKTVVTDLQNKSIAAKSSLELIDQLIADVEANPAAIGGIGKMREEGAGWLGQLGYQDIPLLSPLAEAGRNMVTTDKVVSDPNAPGGQRTISAQTLGSGHQLMVNMIKPMVADKGALSNADQIRLDFATANLNSADARQRTDAYRSLKTVIQNNKEWADRILGESKNYVPGSAPGTAVPPELNSQIEEALRVLMEGGQQ